MNKEKSRSPPFFVIGGAKEHILPEGGVLDPGGLTHIADAATHRAATS